MLYCEWCGQEVNNSGAVCYNINCPSKNSPANEEKLTGRIANLSIGIEKFEGDLTPEQEKINQIIDYINMMVCK